MRNKILLNLGIILFFIGFIPLFNYSFVTKQTKSSDAVDYQLPLPGILPDHPLYKLKVLRDKIIYRLIFNPIKKIEYNLLMADKTINASLVLVDKGNIALVKETALKGEHYFTLLVTDYKWTFWYGHKIPEELDRKIKIAAQKHQEVLNEIVEKVESEDKKIFQQVIDFSKRNCQELLNLKSSVNR